MSPSNKSELLDITLTRRQRVISKLKTRWLTLRWWQRALLVLLSLLVLGIIVFLVLLIVVLIRAGSASIQPSNFPILNNAHTPGVDDGKFLERARKLGEALKFQTISYDIGNQNFPAFLQLHDFLEKSFPEVYKSDFITVEKVNTYSLLFTVTGSENKNKLPYLLAAHLDVVPANPASWEIPPFSGQIVNDTFIYGRGTIDDKSAVMAILEALEYRLINVGRPKRSFYIAFGHDEEIFGLEGAQEIVKKLKSRGVNKLDFVLDEGLFVTDGIFPGVEKQVALIGVAEKGLLSLELSVNGTPGHSSFPPWETSIGILAGAVSRLEKNKLPSMLGQGIERTLFESLAPSMPFSQRMLYANFWLFTSLLTSKLEESNHMNSLIRTTTAMTIINGGIKDNVVPALATATVNHRIHPSQSVGEVVEFDRRVIDDPRVNIKIKMGREPLPTAPYGPEDVHYQLISTTILQTFENVVVAPSFLVANTDTVWYVPMCNRIFRFFPTIQNPADVNRFHGNNERIAIANFAKSVSFFHRLIQNADLVIDFARPESSTV